MTEIKNIPIAKTVFTDAEFEAIQKPLQTGWVVQGPYVKEFESKWNTFTGAEFSVATTSCTTALHIVLYALGIGKGDEVILPSFTWIATANAIEVLGAKPVFCDISLETYNIDCSKIESLITPNTKAIIPVHLFGLAVNMDDVSAIAKKHGLFVIEDAACGFAALFKGKHVGTFGDAGCFSFHPRKAITTGEGGMVTTNNAELDTKLRALRDHGASMSDLQRHHGNKPYLLPEFPYAGFNYRMTDIQAAIGSTQMDRAEEIYSQRNAIAENYNNLLKDISWLQLPAVKPDFRHGYQSYVCLFMPDAINSQSIELLNQKRNQFMDFLLGKGISTRPGTHAVHMLEYYAHKYAIKKEDCRNAYIADSLTISFPVFPALTAQEQDYIAKTICSYNP